MCDTAKTLQPWLHDKLALLQAPCQLWMGKDGVVDGASATGFYMGDVRLISAIVLDVNGEVPTPISVSRDSADTALIVSVPRSLEGPTADPRFRVTVSQHVQTWGMTQQIVIESGRDDDVQLPVRVTVVPDMSTMQEIKGGARSSALERNAIKINIDPGNGIDVADDQGNAYTVRADHVDDVSWHAHAVTLTWHCKVPANGEVRLSWDLVAQPNRVAPVAAAITPCPWANMRVTGADWRVCQWINTSLQDLAALRMTIADDPDHVFLAAGAPWYFTLFGRDSLWSARFMLPLDITVAMDTLRVLARFQATEHDVQSNAEPGKIMHELRGERLVSQGTFAGTLSLPPLYYGTIDATPLWIIVLGEALRWGAPTEEVRELLPNLQAALAWLRDWGDCDGDGFLEYVDRTGHGLSNQGWKDSGDSVRWNDGRIADGPIALCEVQGYAYQAALEGAELLETFGLPGAEEWRSWAAQLKMRFNEQFWVDDGRGRYPAIALDKDKRPVDSLTSNIGHLLGTGILDDDGVKDVVARLTGDDMLSGYGVRTMSVSAGGYWPESYHCGSVWAHDSAIIMNGLRAEGYHDEAVQVAEGLVRAAAAFDYQIPELYSGDAWCGGDERRPAPYPAACHPQAWSAASSISVLALLLDLKPDGSSSPLIDPPLARDLRMVRDAG
ncbi:glycogen debranching N-terminal domain-containing protein [Bifidobacterium olomucense]|uniref:Amylo-alpha-1,6-glucosidase n=1 Tax=Bifidobacterium olomucense TaxID=2675324 RepID=A0A7Y0EZU0_9BIFI|nr:glycogen debranching N-terminal domain-containing protein [Bifidobacterium sp. DSM 109959]NMM98456.1 amylo-alpha-1,6-glucosidase [Bifidobacterium sp. DSM 109959]